MEKNDIIIELPGTGKEVTLSEFWACDNDLYPGSESGEYIDVISSEDNSILCTIPGCLPEKDSEDYDEEMEAIIERVIEEI